MNELQARTKGASAPVVDDGWRIPDTLWQRLEPLLPPHKPHPLGCHNPRVADRKAMDAIFFVLRTGCRLGWPFATTGSEKFIELFNQLFVGHWLRRGMSMPGILRPIPTSGPMRSRAAWARR